MAPIDFEEFLRSSRREEDPTDYHLVRRRDVKRGCAPKHQRIKEFDLRVKKANRYYRGRYDMRHKNWMKGLIYDVKLGDKLSMSLDTYKAFVEM